MVFGMERFSQVIQETPASTLSDLGIPSETVDDWKEGNDIPPEWCQRLLLEHLAGIDRVGKIAAAMKDGDEKTAQQLLGE